MKLSSVMTLNFLCEVCEEQCVDGGQHESAAALVALNYGACEHIDNRLLFKLIANTIHRVVNDDPAESIFIQP